MHFSDLRSILRFWISLRRKKSRHDNTFRRRNVSGCCCWLLTLFRVSYFLEVCLATGEIWRSTHLSHRRSTHLSCQRVRRWRQSTWLARRVTHVSAILRWFDTDFFYPIFLCSFAPRHARETFVTDNYFVSRIGVVSTWCSNFCWFHRFFCHVLCLVDYIT